MFWNKGQCLPISSQQHTQIDLAQDKLLRPHQLIALVAAGLGIPVECLTLQPLQGLSTLAPAPAQGGSVSQAACQISPCTSSILTAQGYSAGLQAMETQPSRHSLVSVRRLFVISFWSFCKSRFLSTFCLKNWCWSVSIMQYAHNRREGGEFNNNFNFVFI